jgi:hypothetical protein
MMCSLGTERFSSAGLPGLRMGQSWHTLTDCSPRCYDLSLEAPDHRNPMIEPTLAPVEGPPECSCLTTFSPRVA